MSTKLSADYMDHTTCIFRPSRDVILYIISLAKSLLVCWICTTFEAQFEIHCKVKHKESKKGFSCLEGLLLANLEYSREWAEGMNHSDAVVPDGRDNATNGLPYIPFSHATIPAGYNLLGGKPMDSAGQHTRSSSAVRKPFSAVSACAKLFHVDQSRQARQ